MGYLFAVHVPIVGLSLLPLFGGPVLLLPVHVVLLELIIDPACSLVFEAEPARSDAMSVPPRSAGDPAVRRAPRSRARCWSAGSALVAVVLVQWLGRAASLLRRRAATGRPGDDRRRQSRHPAVVSRGLTRARGRNRTFYSLVLAVCVLAGLVLLIEPLRRTFGLPGDVEPRLVLTLLAIPVALSPHGDCAPASVARVIEKPGQRADDQQDERRDGACRKREKLGDMDPVHGRHSTDSARMLVDLAQARCPVGALLPQKLIASPSAHPWVAGPNL